MLSVSLHVGVWFPGVGHGDELLYLFRSPIAFGQHSASDNHMSEVLTTYWANFARTGYVSWR